jgi:hypothetical protein
MYRRGRMENIKYKFNNFRHRCGYSNENGKSPGPGNINLEVIKYVGIVASWTATGTRTPRLYVTMHSYILLCLP